MIIKDEKQVLWRKEEKYKFGGRMIRLVLSSFSVQEIVALRARGKYCAVCSHLATNLGA